MKEVTLTIRMSDEFAAGDEEGSDPNSLTRLAASGEPLYIYASGYCMTHQMGALVLGTNEELLTRPPSKDESHCITDTMSKMLPKGYVKVLQIERVRPDPPSGTQH